MTNIAVAIADAMLAELSAHTFATPITGFSRKYVPVLDLRSLDGVQLTVVPRSVGIANADRSRTSNEVAVDIAIQRKVGSVNPSDCDPLMELVQEVADFLTRRRLPAVPQASWLRIANVPIYSPEHLQGKQMFTSVLTVTYLVHR